MKSRAYVMLGLALLLAVASVFLARSWIQDRMQPVAAIQDKPQVETTQVVVAASKLQFGNKIRREHLRVVDWPAAAVPEGSFKSIDDILGKKETSGKEKNKEIPARVALRTIEVNEPILKGKITGFGGRASLSTLIAPGMRATTIRVNDITGVAGFVLPGDRVDILLTRDPNGTGGRRGRGGNLQTDVFLQNMKVLAIAQDANEDRSKPAVVKAVTLEVTPIQAQKLTLAQKLGSLSLALRHVNTVNAIAPRSIKARDLRVGEANLAPDPKGGRVKATGGETTLILEPQVTEKKTVVTKTVSKKTRKNLSLIKIVRGLTATEYDVTPEKPTFSAPAYSKPLNLLPSKLAPIGAPIVPAAAPVPLAPSLLAPKSLAPKSLTPKSLTPVAPGKLAPAGDEPVKVNAEADGKTALDSDSKLLPNSKPISLLKSGGLQGEDG